MELIFPGLVVAGLLVLNLSTPGLTLRGMATPGLVASFWRPSGMFPDIPGDRIERQGYSVDAKN